MAAIAPPEMASGNPCCLAWQRKYMKMKERRDAFKEVSDLLQKENGHVNAEKANLKKKLGELAADRDTKENDSAVKASLEKELSYLKSEILSLQQRLEQNRKEKSEEIKLLQEQASSGEQEINELKDLLSKETLRADNSEKEREKVGKELNRTKAHMVKNDDIKPHFPEVGKEISLVKSLLASERQKADSERKKAESEKKKADQYHSELEVLRTTAHKTSSDLLTLTSNLETVKKQLEFEKQKTLKERNRADMESAKAREQMKLAEGLSKKFEMVRAKNEELKKEMELQIASSKVKFAENSAKLEEKTRLLEMNKKTAMDWKSRADDLTRQLQEAQLVTEGLKKQLHELSLSQKSAQTRSVSPHKVKDLEKAEVRLLKKELKFERKRAKHSQKVANLEKYRREIQAEDLGRLKLELGSFTNRFNLLAQYFSRDAEGTAGLGQAKGHMKLQTLQSQKNCNGEKHSDAICHLLASAGSQEQACKLSAQLIPKSGRGVSESVSGTISQLESPTGGSKTLQSSGVISSATSFSDGQLLASQGRKQFSVTTPAEIAKDKPNIQPIESSLLPKTSDARKIGNLLLVAKNVLQSRQRDSHEVVKEHSQKRKRMPEAVDSCKHLSSDDRKKNMQIGEKVGTLQSMVVGGSSANCVTISKKRRISCQKKTITQNSLELNKAGKAPGNIAGSTQVSWESMCLSNTKGHDAATSFLDDVVATDYMKLLELDDVEKENYYKTARESLLSPDLPQLDFLGGEIVNEDKTPARALDLVASNSARLQDTINSSEAPSLNTQNASATVKKPPMPTTTHGHIPKHFVVFSNIEDQSSVIKIFHAANNCIQLCPSVTRAQWAVPAILSSLKMEENLLAQERVCVFLSLLLHNFSVVSSMKSGNSPNVDSFSCLDSFSKHIYGVMADIEAGGMLSEFLEELLSLLENLLSEQRVLFSVESSETPELDLSIPVTLNGENIVLFIGIALIDHLVAGSAIFAAICCARDRVGFICEASFEILHKHSQEKTSMLLTILHVFAYVAGEKMVSSSEHDMEIAVLKSIVMFLENKDFDTLEGKGKLHPGKNKCPFSDRSSSLEAVASMLVEILKEFSQSNTLHQSLTSSLGGSSHLEKTEYIPECKDFQCVLTKNQSVTLYRLCDILSLLELIASYTAWDWINTNIVAPLLKMLGTPLPMNLSVAIVSLLGQLGSIGVDTGGYENEGISNLREKLSAFLQRETTLKAGFAVQIATVSSLLKTIQLGFPEVFEGKTTMLPCGGLSASVNLVTKWFSLLSDEQRAFTSEFLQSSCR